MRHTGIVITRTWTRSSAGLVSFAQGKTREERVGRCAATQIGAQIVAPTEGLLTQLISTCSLCCSQSRPLFVLSTMEQRKCGRPVGSKKKIEIQTFSESDTSILRFGLVYQSENEENLSQRGKISNSLNKGNCSDKYERPIHQ